MHDQLLVGKSEVVVNILVVVDKILHSNHRTVLQNSSENNPIPSFSDHIPFCKAISCHLQLLQAIPAAPSYVRRRRLHRRTTTALFDLHLLRIVVHVFDSEHLRDLLGDERDCAGAVLHPHLALLGAPAPASAEEDDEQGRNHDQEENEDQEVEFEA